MAIKEYIENEYYLALLDFKLAKNDDERFGALRAIAKLEELAIKSYGFSYNDELREKMGVISCVSR